MSQHWWFSSQLHTRLELKAGINGRFFINESGFQDHLRPSPLVNVYFGFTLLFVNMFAHTQNLTLEPYLTCNKNNSCFIVYLAMALSHLFMEVITSKLMKICTHQSDIKILFTITKGLGLLSILIKEDSI